MGRPGLQQIGRLGSEGHYRAHGMLADARDARAQGAPPIELGIYPYCNRRGFSTRCFGPADEMAGLVLALAFSSERHGFWIAAANVRRQRQKSARSVSSRTSWISNARPPT